MTAAVACGEVTAVVAGAAVATGAVVGGVVTAVVAGAAVVTGIVVVVDGFDGLLPQAEPNIATTTPATTHRGFMRAEHRPCLCDFPDGAPHMAIDHG